MKDRSFTINGNHFSSQELLIVFELKKGSTYQEIGEKLSISTRTVEYRIRDLKEKTGVSDKNELIRFFDNASEKMEDIIIPVQEESLLKCQINRTSLAMVSVLILGISTFVYLKMTSSRETVVMNVEGVGKDFLMREGLIKRIKAVLRSGGGINTAVIVGSGGAGKTTIARSIVTNSQAKIKFEINAETEESIFASFLTLADCIADSSILQQKLDVIKNLRRMRSKKNNLIRFVSNVLKKSGDWILLFDNIVTIKKIKEYLPLNMENWGNGQVLITTRNENINASKFISSSQMIHMEDLNQVEKRTLFCRILYETEFSNLDSQQMEKVDKFLSNIPSMPLDVCAAAYYLKSTKISMAEYIRTMKESIDKLTVQEKKFLEENANYSETRYGIVSSIFDEVLKSNEKFSSLLLAVSALNSQEIPKKILELVSDSITTGEFIYKLKGQSLISDNGDTISIHRSTQSIGYDYLLKVLSDEDKRVKLQEITRTLTKENELGHGVFRSVKMLPHIDSMLEKLSDERISDIGLEREKIALLCLKGEILLYETHRIPDSLECFQKAQELGNRKNCLEKLEAALIHLKIGKAYTLMGSNVNAELYLRSSLLNLSENSIELAENYRLLGVVLMRSKKFEEANTSFTRALEVLKRVKGDETNLGILESDIYSAMSFNYFMDGINRENAKRAVPLMERAIEILSKIDGRKIVGKLAEHKIRLAGIYNALGKYDTALKISDEVEKLIIESGLNDYNTFYVRGIIARERGLSNLRLNNIEKAYNYFLKAKEIFTKSMTQDYLFKIKMHEAECLVQMNRLSEAFEICQRMFSETNRERNNYSDLFFNTCYYHAAVIKYRQGDLSASKEYFQKFVRSMREFCKEILKTDEYNKLIHEDAFNVIPKTMREFFENSLKIFEAIYWKDYEFTKYYVEQNLKMVK